MKTETKNTAFEAEILRQFAILNARLTGVETYLCEIRDSSYDDEIRRLRHECAERRKQNEFLTKRLNAAYMFMSYNDVNDIKTGMYD